MKIKFTVLMLSFIIFFTELAFGNSGFRLEVVRNDAQVGGELHVALLYTHHYLGGTHSVRHIHAEIVYETELEPSSTEPYGWSNNLLNYTLNHTELPNKYIVDVMYYLPECCGADDDLWEPNGEECIVVLVWDIVSATSTDIRLPDDLQSSASLGYIDACYNGECNDQHTVHFSDTEDLIDIPLNFDHFSFDIIPSPQIVGYPFEITITAIDGNNNIFTGFTGTVDLTTDVGTIEPIATENFENGKITQWVTLTGEGKHTISATRTNGTETGNSNVFFLENSVLHNFSFKFIPVSQVAYIPFEISIAAKDETNNTVTSFTGTVDLSTTSGNISPLKTENFVNGEITLDVKISAPGEQVITATRTEGTETGSSNRFEVEPLRIDNLITDVEKLETVGVLNSGQANSLISKLESAQAKLDEGKFRPALNKLNSFIHQVSSLIAEGILTTPQGQSLIDCTTEIIDQINSTLGKQSVAEDIPVSTLSQYFVLNQNYPNPFNSNTEIEFVVLRGALPVSLKIYDVTGKEIRSLLNETIGVGQYWISWDGLDNAGNSVAAGLYLYRLRAGKVAETRQMILVK